MFQDGMFEIGEITVTDPMKKVKGMGLNPFICYKVRTTGLSGAAVERRYNDFYWLFESFIALYPGAIIPQIPEKSAFKRYDEDYVDNRRKRLEVFLNRVAKHPLLSKTDNFEVFLLANDAKLESMKAQERASRQSTLSWLSDNFANLNPIDMFDYDSKDEIDEMFAKKHSKMKTLLKCTTDLTDAAVLMVKAICESSIALSQVGADIIQWSKDDEDEVLKSRLEKVGSSCSTISVQIGRFAQAKFENLEEPLQDCVGMIIAAVNAFERREQARLYYLRCKKDTVSHAEGKLSTLSMANSLITSKKELHAKAVMAEETARSRLEQISNMLKGEFIEFEKTRVPEIKEVIINFTKIQVLMEILFIFEIISHRRTTTPSCEW